MNSMVQITVGGRTMLVAPKVASRVREQVQINREKSIRLSRELKQSGLLPRQPNDQFTGWQGTRTFHHARPKSIMDNRAIYQADKLSANLERFDRFLLTVR